MRLSEIFASTLMVFGALYFIIILIETEFLSDNEDLFIRFVIYSIIGLIILSISLFAIAFYNIRFEEEGFRPIIVSSSISVGILLILVSSFIFGLNEDYESFTFFITLITFAVLFYYLIRGRLYEQEAETISCKNCQEEISNYFIVCPFCGHHVAEMCPSCKRTVDESFNWCPYCTEELVAIKSSK
ncbi:MAG: zinc ribbon domain-containing protein [Candidatus Heimdallarchaeota archaeon]|nr:zinc ribbon domain-containing protein [Candidatus Heimdallarchaeota archaeon]MCK5049092.1 zinc ribbon domain-containing protein [Candidatus Heimdallarchaeota archaeon]